MALGLLATKMGMTQIFTEEGVRVPVTIVKVDENVVVQKRSLAIDGYTALQIGYGDKREKNSTKAEIGHCKKAGLGIKRRLNEWRVEEDVLGQYEVGASIPLSIFESVDAVDIAGIGKGKGFAGVMKRHNFKGFRATHGTHEYFRHGGSIGCRATPGKVFKGKKMPGQMGNVRTISTNIAVVGLAEDERLMFLRGPVPGAKGDVVELTASARKAKRGRGLSQAAQTRSKNPMKASKAKGG